MKPFKYLALSVLITSAIMGLLYGVGLLADYSAHECVFHHNCTLDRALDISSYVLCFVGVTGTIFSFLMLRGQK